MAGTEFRRIDFAQVPGGANAACERLPDMPAVYAFFAPLPIVPVETTDAFVAAINELVEMPAAPVLAARAGSLHDIMLDSRSRLSSHKQHLLKEHAADESFRDELALLVSSCMPLRAPLYVGQTSTLHGRIRQHLVASSDLSTRLRSSGIRLERCVVAYRLMPELDILRTSEALTLAEEIVTRMLRPGYVSRIG